MAAIHLPLPQSRRGFPLPFGSPLGRPNWWVLAAVAVVAISAMLPVVQNSTATSRGFQIQDLDGKKAELSGQIRLLESDVAGLTSLARIERRAREIGLEPGLDPLYVTVSEAGPEPAKLPSSYLPGPSRPAPKPEAWWRSLLSWVPLPH